MSPWSPIGSRCTCSIGLSLWSLWFVVLYGGLSVGCDLRPPDSGAGRVTWINAPCWS